MAKEDSDWCQVLLARSETLQQWRNGQHLIAEAELKSSQVLHVRQ